MCFTRRVREPRYAREVLTAYAGVRSCRPRCYLPSGRRARETGHDRAGPADERASSKSSHRRAAISAWACRSRWVWPSRSRSRMRAAASAPAPACSWGWSATRALGWWSEWRAGGVPFACRSAYSSACCLRVGGVWLGIGRRVRRVSFGFWGRVVGGSSAGPVLVGVLVGVLAGPVVGRRLSGVVSWGLSSGRQQAAISSLSCRARPRCAPRSRRSATVVGAPWQRAACAS